MSANITTRVKPNAITRWAVAYTVDDGPETLLGFSARKNKWILIDYVRAGGQLADVFDAIPAGARCSYSTRDGFRCAGIRIYFNGYTERDYKNRVNGPGDSTGPRPVQAVIA